MKFLYVLDPYGRSPPFAPLGALGSGAFGGLGSPSLGQCKRFILEFPARDTHNPKDLTKGCDNFL